MTAPGQLDENGWRVPKKEFTRRIYYLYKAGYGPSSIAWLLDTSRKSVEVTLHYIKNPKRTPFGWRFNTIPKTARSIDHNRFGMTQERLNEELRNRSGHRVSHRRPRSGGAWSK